jgi:hypothetical protein
MKHRIDWRMPFKRYNREGRRKYPEQATVKGDEQAGPKATKVLRQTQKEKAKPTDSHRNYNRACCAVNQRRLLIKEGRVCPRKCPPRTPAAPQPWRARAVHITLTMCKSHAQFPAVISEKQPPGQQQESAQRR